MMLYLRLAWRNIWRHRRRTFIVVGAIGFTMMLMMMYDGLIAGFQDDIYGNAIQVLGGNIQVHAAGYQDKADQTPLLPLPNDQQVVAAALAQPQVAAASRRINTGGLVTNRQGSFAVGITGIEPEKELPVNLIAQHVTVGKFLTSSDGDVVLIGKGLADAMQVTVGDRITVAGKAQHSQMNKRTLTVTGIYDVGMTDIEKRTVYISLAEAQDFLGLPGQSTEVAITLKHIGNEAAVMSAINAAMPGYDMGSWQTNFPELETAIATKSAGMDVFSVMILFIVGIGILNLLLMAVFERTREIGILAALGVKPGSITLLFLLEGALMGLAGAAVGVVLGLALNVLMMNVGFDFSQFASLSTYTALLTGKIYPTLGLEKIGLRLAVIIIISVLAAWYPARQAATIEPAQALHYV
jgi:ABC-type lipoprotein release transport system permease subunit